MLAPVGKQSKDRPLFFFRFYLYIAYSSACLKREERKGRGGLVLRAALTITRSGLVGWAESDFPYSRYFVVLML